MDLNFVPAIAGATVGGIFSYIAVRITINNQNVKLAAAAESEVSAFCKAIHAELDSLLVRYKDSIGGALEEQDPEKAFTVYFPIFENYLTVFSSNAHFLGKVKDDNLRSGIVHAYMTTKGHIDTLRYNNEMINKLEQFSIKTNGSSNEQAQQQSQKYERLLKGYSPMLIGSHKNFVRSVENILNDLKVATTKPL